jgi:hypothetical protein
MRVNKSELAQILGVSLPTLAAWMADHGDAFPVLERGGRGRDWWFDHEAVTAFLDARKAEEEAGDAERQASLRQIMLPLGHNGGPPITTEPQRSPAEMLTIMKIRRLQREEAYACGRLVEVHKLKSGLENVLGALNQSLRVTVRRFGREHGLSPEVTDALDEAIKDTQRNLVAYVRGLQKVEEVQPSLFETAAE